MDFSVLWHDVSNLANNPDGIAMADILGLPTPLRRLFRGLVRKKQITQVELAEALNLSAHETRQLADLLVEKGYLFLVAPADESHPRYQLYFSPKPTTQMANRVWDVLDDL